MTPALLYVCWINVLSETLNPAPLIRPLQSSWTRTTCHWPQQCLQPRPTVSPSPSCRWPAACRRRNTCCVFMVRSCSQHQLVKCSQCGDGYDFISMFLMFSVNSNDKIALHKGGCNVYFCGRVWSVCGHVRKKKPH